MSPAAASFFARASRLSSSSRCSLPDRRRRVHRELPGLCVAVPSSSSGGTNRELSTTMRFRDAMVTKGPPLVATNPHASGAALFPQRRLRLWHERSSAQNENPLLSSRRGVSSVGSPGKPKMIPRKAAVKLTPKARAAFRQLLEMTESAEGVMLKYEISSKQTFGMAFKLDFIRLDQLNPDDEGVSLEVLEDGETPKPPSESWNDGLPKLYVHGGGFMKVLGGTLDVSIDTETGGFKPILYDREGHEMDPNA